MNKIRKLRHIPLVGVVALFCGCSGTAHLNENQSAQLLLALQSKDAGCGRFTFTNATRTEVREIQTASNAEQVSPVSGLAYGDTEVTAEWWVDACGDGEPDYVASPQKVTLEPDREPGVLKFYFTGNARLGLEAEFEGVKFASCTNPVNVALGADASRSSNGWAGGQSKADLTDGLAAYCDSWARGLAYTGGPNSWGGESCGYRQTTIDLGATNVHNVERAVLYFHGREHLPLAEQLEGSIDGQTWFAIENTKAIRLDLETYVDGCWGATPVEYVFAAPTAVRFVRHSIDNCNCGFLQIDNGNHGWLYEAQLWSCAE